MENGGKHRPIRRTITTGVMAGALLVSTLLQPAQAGGLRGDMLNLVNDTRADAGRRTLKLDRQLSRYASRHSAQMIRRNQLFHTSNLSAVLPRRGWSKTAEIVGVGPTVRTIHASFMDSRAHRLHLLGKRFDHVGIGIRSGRGDLWATLIFYG